MGTGKGNGEGAKRISQTSNIEKYYNAGLTPCTPGIRALVGPETYGDLVGRAA